MTSENGPKENINLTEKKITLHREIMPIFNTHTRTQARESMRNPPVK